MARRGFRKIWQRLSRSTRARFPFGVLAAWILECRAAEESIGTRIVAQGFASRRRKPYVFNSESRFQERGMHPTPLFSHLRQCSAGIVPQPLPKSNALRLSLCGEASTPFFQPLFKRNHRDFHLGVRFAAPPQFEGTNDFCGNARNAIQNCAVN